MSDQENRAGHGSSCEEGSDPDDAELRQLRAREAQLLTEQAHVLNQLMSLKGCEHAHMDGNRGHGVARPEQCIDAGYYTHRQTFGVSSKPLRVIAAGSPEHLRLQRLQLKVVASTYRTAGRKCSSSMQQPRCASRPGGQRLAKSTSCSSIAVMEHDASMQGAPLRHLDGTMQGGQKDSSAIHNPQYHAPQHYRQLFPVSGIATQPSADLRSLPAYMSFISPTLSTLSSSFPRTTSSYQSSQLHHASAFRMSCSDGHLDRLVAENSVPPFPVPRRYPSDWQQSSTPYMPSQPLVACYSPRYVPTLQACNPHVSDRVLVTHHPWKDHNHSLAMTHHGSTARHAFGGNQGTTMADCQWAGHATHAKNTVFRPEEQSQPNASNISCARERAPSPSSVPHEGAVSQMCDSGGGFVQPIDSDFKCNELQERKGTTPTKDEVDLDNWEDLMHTFIDFEQLEASLPEQ